MDLHDQNALVIDDEPNSGAATEFVLSLRECFTAARHRREDAFQPVAPGIVVERIFGEAIPCVDGGSALGGQKI